MSDKYSLACCHSLCAKGVQVEREGEPGSQRSIHQDSSGLLLSLSGTLTGSSSGGGRIAVCGEAEVELEADVVAVVASERKGEDDGRERVVVLLVVVVVEGEENDGNSLAGSNTDRGSWIGADGLGRGVFQRGGVDAAWVDGAGM